MYLRNEWGCGLRRSTLYIKVCITFRQLLFLRQNGPKKRFKGLWKVKNCQVFQRDAALLKLLRYWGVTTEPSNVLLKIANRDTYWETPPPQINCQRFEKNQTWSYQEPIILQCCHIPELQPTQSVQKYKVFSAYRHGQGKEGWNPTTNEQNTQVETSRLGQEISEDRFFKRFYGLMRWEWLLMDQMDGPVAGSVTDTAPVPHLHASKVEVRYWYGLLLLNY